MLTRIELHNFRGLRAFVAELGPVTALLGPNSSGKTTVLHAIRSACDLLRFALEADGTCKVKVSDGRARVIVAEKLLIPDVRAVFSLSDWQALFVDQAVGDGVTARIQLEFADDQPLDVLDVRLVCGRNQQLKLDIDLFSADAVARVDGIPKKSPRVNQLLSERIEAIAPRAVLVPPFYGTVPDEEYRARVVIDRLLGTGDQSHVVRNLLAGLDTERFGRLNAFLAATLGAQLIYRTDGDRLQTESPLRVTFRDSNGEIELSAAGAGLINLVALYASLARWRQEASQRPVIFLLDEPEAHLAPRLQAESAARLSRLVVDDFGAQLLMATHSIDILNRLSQEGALLLRCDRTAEPSATTLGGDAALFADLGTWTDLTPYTAINFLASRRVVFVEGKTDKELLPTLARLLFRDDPARLAAFERWAIVELNGTGNRPIADLLGRLLGHEVLRLDSDERPFRIEVVLDRDYAPDRTPGLTIDAEGTATTVWSRHSIESLFVDAGILAEWTRARLGREVPLPRLPAIIRDAIRVTDGDSGLNQRAIDELSAGAVLAGLRSGISLAAHNGKVIKTGVSKARASVESQPEVWQRGKDRCRRVLGLIRDDLPPEHQGHFPTSIETLVERADRNAIADPRTAIPAEVVAFLDRLVT